MSDPINDENRPLNDNNKGKRWRFSSRRNNQNNNGNNNTNNNKPAGSNNQNNKQGQGGNGRSRYPYIPPILRQNKGKNADPNPRPNKNGKQNPNVGDQIKQSQANRQDENTKKGMRALQDISNAPGSMIDRAFAKSALNTSRGDRYIDAYKKGATDAEGRALIRKEIRKDKRRIKTIATIVGFFLFIFFLLMLVAILVKVVDSQIFSNDNDGTVLSEDYENYPDDKVVNIFANYPELYERIVESVNRVSNQYKIDLDKYLVVSTLITPLSNDLIVPVEDNSCGEEKCYYFQGKPMTWKDFLKVWSDQAELLAKMQILTYVSKDNALGAKCGEAQTMEQYAKNDGETNTFEWFGWLNPVNWFKGFKDVADVEINAKCNDARSGSSVIPPVRELSIAEGEYTLTEDKDGKPTYVTNPNSGGVYWWNLINQNGFLHEYLKDYLSDEDSGNPEKNYEHNRKKIIDTAIDIYSYYQTIKKDCHDFPVMKGELKKIKFREDPQSPMYNLDFEEVFIGGNLLATFPGAKGEVAKAQAIITRSEAYYNIVMEGADHITGTVIMGCWWWKYNPTYDPSYENQADNPNYDPNYPKEHFPEIYKAVTETKGILVTQYGTTNVLNTQFDSFCPVTRDPQGGFYYLPDGQRKLPIDTSRFAISKKRTECPCFQNKSSRPSVEYSDSFSNLLNKRVGNPGQTTTETCWESDGSTKTDFWGNTLYGYKYSTSGGHGEGVSQHGMAYFSQFGYDAQALVKLFMERNNRGVSFKIYDDSIEDGECDNHGYYDPKKEKGNGKGGSSSSVNDIGDSNHTEVIGGTRLTEALTTALAKQGNTIDDLNKCISDRVEKAGYGTRAGVVEAGVGLIQCTSDLTGGYILTYNHSGADPNASNPDLHNKLGVNSKWGLPGGSCPKGNCRLGLNCATFVRWAMCNGGMLMCDRGSRAAHEMFETTFFPGAVKIITGPGFRVVRGETTISSAEEAFDSIKPGDLFYSEHYPRIEEADHGNHVMLVVGKTDDSITIAENGQNTRVITKSAIVSPRNLTYGVLLLDEYYANSANVNDLHW